MKILSWNYRELGNPVVVRVLSHLLKDKDPDVVFLSETKLKEGKTTALKPRVQGEWNFCQLCRGGANQKRGFGYICCGRELG